MKLSVSATLSYVLLASGVSCHLVFESNECLKLTIEKGLSIKYLENIDFNISGNERKTINQISQLIIEITDPENENNDFCKYYNIL